MMKCKFRCIHFMLEFFKMENSAANFENCSCDEPEIVESDFCEVSFPKDKKSKINLFGLCRDKSLPFSSKRNKKSMIATTSSTNKTISKKSPKWGIKFNCTKKETKTALNSGNQNCCRCTCYKHTNENEALPVQSTSDFSEDQEPISDHHQVCSASTSNSTCNGNDMEVGEQSPNQLEDNGNARGLYSVVPSSLQMNNVSNLIVTPPFSNVHW